ncbi:MAG: hypothetical protein RL217_849 [Pseudomonadota bacterium]|jgi:CDP-4-dehydro-6-deoxyglucose reductase
MPKITFQPANIQIHCTPEQSIAEAAQEQGVEMFLGCDNGLCMICQSERISGTFHFRNDLGLDVLEREDRVLCCVVKPLTDAELYMPSIHAADHIKPNSYACQIARVVEIGAAMWQVILRLPAGKKQNYWAGQHLFLHIPDSKQQEELVPFSIANAPAELMETDPRELELLIACHSETALNIIRFLQQAVVVHATLPMGECIINSRFLATHYGEPLIMVAAGSGFSQIKCLLEATLKLSPKQSIHLYWSNKTASEFYLVEWIKNLEKMHANFHAHLILEKTEPNWAGRTGWLYQVIEQDFNDLRRTQVFACGSANMVYGTLDKLAERGLSLANMHSDTFQYAPRA